MAHLSHNCQIKLRQTSGCWLNKLMLKLFVTFTLIFWKEIVLEGDFVGEGFCHLTEQYIMSSKKVWLFQFSHSIPNHPLTRGFDMLIRDQ